MRTGPAIASGSERAASSGLDWDAAVRIAQRLAPIGPRVSAVEARHAVIDLRRYAAEAELRVRETTGLGLDLPVADVEVVDRRGWISASAEGMAELTGPLAERMASAGGSLSGASAPLGSVLAFLSSRVLGQYDPIARGGLLLLVAPNVVHVEREIGAEPADFRLWVCLHESTHRLQFAAVPWLADYFRSLVAEYTALTPADSSQLAARLKSAVRAARQSGGGAGGEADSDDGPHTNSAPGRGDAMANSWIRRIHTPDQQQVFDRLMALMTLLEGHADYVMDAVGPTVIPSVEKIRGAFTERRRRGRGPIDRLLRSLLGMDAKMAQYARGAAFVRTVVDEIGMTPFNAVFTGADTLPTIGEIDDPHAWIRRVHGG